jgi:Calpain family cysteine protease
MKDETPEYRKETRKNVEKGSETIGVVNPFALAEVILKKRINWKRIKEPRKLLEKTLNTKYEKLFDPKYKSPLYPNLKYDTKTKKVERLKKPSTDREVHVLAPDLTVPIIWSDPGDFFEEAAEMTDPVQGAVANCYFIAALSSVSWARTYVIAQRSRATGTNQNQFVDMIEFFNNSSKAETEVTESIPLNNPGNTFIYARSSEAGEIWPAIYEKAFAKWKTNDPGDTPDILATAYGDTVLAAAQLTGLNRYYYSNASLTEDEIWQKVRENSISFKTFNPMMAWTYGSGDASPDHVDYSDATLVANHAYSILGWQYANNQKYIVLRNPWGTYEGTLNVDGGTWIAWDQPHYAGRGWWRPIAMSTNDGIFALRTDTFKSYFAGFGLVK